MNHIVTPPASRYGALAELHADRAGSDRRRAPAAPDPFTQIAQITAWLDDTNPAGPHEDAMRVLKLAEEAGEAAAAYIGMVGQNPRKGVTHTLAEVLDEIADVAVAALCAIQHFTQDQAATRAVLTGKLDAITARAGIRPHADPAAPA